MRIRSAKDLGLLAREGRKKLGWGQAELADRMGVSRQWVVAFERGKAGAPLGLVLQALHELGLVLEVRGDEAAPDGALPKLVDLDALIERARRNEP